MVELKGSLSGIGLPAIVQLISELQHSGTLQLSRDDLSSRGTFVFDAGRLVDAACGEAHGLQAVVWCAMELAAGEFVFVEGPPPSDRTLDLGPDDLQKLLTAVASGDFNQHDNGAAEVTQVDVALACPLLGFADDPTRHYSRATALHRCFAGGAAGLVTPPEQRELCLSGHFGACPRFRNVPKVPRVATADATLITPPRVVAPASVATQSASVAEPVARTRVAAAAALPPTAEPTQATELPTQVGREISAPPPPRVAVKPPARRRGFVYIGGGIVAGLLLVAVLLVLVLPRLTAGLASSVATPALNPVATAAGVAVAAGRATAIATLAVQPRATTGPTSPPTSAPTPVPTAAPTQTAIPTMPPRTSIAAPVVQPSAASGGPSLMDVRFAIGPGDRWLENPPYAGWSDGAYRMFAKDPARFVAVGVPLGRVISDVVINATFRKTGGPPGGGYGVVVRDQGPEPRDGVNQQASAYVLETGDLGEYGVWRRDGDHWVDLVPWTRSSSIRPGGSPNELTVRAIGDHLLFKVNGADLVDVQDSNLVGGGIGVFVGGDYNEIALDHFVVSSPD